FRRAQRAERAAMRKRRRAYALGILFLTAVCIGWWKQAALKEQYHWRVKMGPMVLSAAHEKDRTSKPGSAFKEGKEGCPTMVIVPAGKFVMGSPVTILGNSNETPQHEVIIDKPFAAGKTEVTFAEWDQCVAAGACPSAPDIGWGRDDRPVINVSWVDAN